MTRREFNATLKRIKLAKGGVSESKARALAAETRAQLVHFIVRNRGPVLAALVTDEQRPWLQACGYLYESRGPVTHLQFVHTSEHVIR